MRQKSKENFQSLPYTQTDCVKNAKEKKPSQPTCCVIKFCFVLDPIADLERKQYQKDVPH